MRNGPKAAGGDITGMAENSAELQRRAILALQQGRIGDGIAAFAALLEREPARPDDWYNLAYLLRCQRSFESALGAYAKALEYGVRKPEEVHLNRAVILADHLDRTSEAKAELETALTMEPGFVPAWLNLGMLCEDLADAAGARRAYGEALRIDPGSGRAHARLAALDVFENRQNEAAERLSNALSGTEIEPDDRIEIEFALGHALDASGRYSEAFDVISAANRAAKGRMPPEIRYDQAEMERLVEGIIEAFPTSAPTGRKAAGNTPIFICGMFRSGSTLAEQILGRHHSVTAGGELEYIPAIVQSRLQPFPDALDGLEPAHAKALRDAYLAELSARFPGHPVVTDKRPDNFLHIGLIKAMFPEARIVHTVRNPVDNALSIFFLHFEYGVNYGFSLDDIVHWFGLYRRLMSHWKLLYPEDILDLDYDRLVSDPGPTISGLLHFCGLDDDPACLAGAPGNTVVRTASVWQVRQPVHARSSGRWLNYREQLLPVAQSLGVEVS